MKKIQILNIFFTMLVVIGAFMLGNHMSYGLVVMLVGFAGQSFHQAYQIKQLKYKLAKVEEKQPV